MLLSKSEEMKPFNEYPRPQMRRENWLNLNGLWKYAITPLNAEEVVEFDGDILVPYCLESPLSGVERRISEKELLWYATEFETEKIVPEKQFLLHFGAVDWQATVILNGNTVDTHQGGYTPFHFDVTSFLVEGINELIVKVFDPTNKGGQQYGKQTQTPEDIFYTPVSGIWQTVWMEEVPNMYISGMKLHPDIDHKEIGIDCQVSGIDYAQVKISIQEQGREVVSVIEQANTFITIPLPNPKLWSPENPFLYDLTLELIDEGNVLDKVESYFGMRKFSIARNSQGVLKLCLNNKEIFQNGLLDQGYWPEGLYTAPDDEALRFDIEIAKKLGFNVLRKHLKIEPARWYYWCDRLGMIVWQDMINGGKLAFDQLIPQLLMAGKLEVAPEILGKLSTGQKMETKEMLEVIGNTVAQVKRDDESDWYELVNRNSLESRNEFNKELKEMVDTLYNVPSIGMWVPFNESWGQFDSRSIGDWLSQYDPSRWVDYASGWIDTGGGKIKSFHSYCEELSSLSPDENRVFTISEYGGFTYTSKDNIEGMFSYGHFQTREELEDAYCNLVRDQVMPLAAKGLSAVIYTQLSDVEGEINGLMSYDRKDIKVDIKKVAEVNEKLIKSPKDKEKVSEILIK